MQSGSRRNGQAFKRSGLADVFAQRQKTESLCVEIHRNKAPGSQFPGEGLEYGKHFLSHAFGKRAVNPELYDAGQAFTAESEHSCKIQILAQDYAGVFFGILKNDVIRISQLSDLPPVGSLMSGLGEKRHPRGREIFIDDQCHARARLCSSEAAMSAAKRREARTASGVRSG